MYKEPKITLSRSEKAQSRRPLATSTSILASGISNRVLVIDDDMKIKTRKNRKINYEL